ncbi:hypothetical protein [Absidia glauca]|uniref:C2H2-type domain-containing protein n=1 Tax=Absidia glauca TaxID=4829 RepID=A0A163J1M7_ABSGL|nr:hypothetical protein [Absidia glauca]
MYSSFQVYPNKQHHDNALTTQQVPEYYSTPAPFVPAFTEPQPFCCYPTFDASLFYDDSPSFLAGPNQQYTGYSLTGNTNIMDDYYLTTPDTMLVPSIAPTSPLSSSSSLSSSSPLLNDYLLMEDPLTQQDQTPTRSPRRAAAKGDFRCPFEGCTKVFGRKYNLSSHQVTHTAERIYACDCCLKTFVRRHDLKRHVRIHTGETPHRCLYCRRGYGRADALQRHYSINKECALSLGNDPSNPLHHKKRTRSTGFGAKS